MKTTLSVSVLFLGACATAEAPLPSTHPASTTAVEAPSMPPSVLARAEKGPLFPVDAEAPMPAGHHHHHGSMAPSPSTDAPAPSSAEPTAPSSPTPSAMPPPSVAPATPATLSGAHDHAEHDAKAPKPAASNAPSAATPPPAASDGAAEVYACPMHPEVTSDKPGKCPKCGMALKKKEKR